MVQNPTFSKPLKRQTLAEQMAASIEEQILAGDLSPGSSLPTEPQMAEQFGVSRAVVRDASRLLMARGLVDVQHGRGAFVTQSQTEAFGHALLLALRRESATVWDVEHFLQLIFPEVVALAATSATESDIGTLSKLQEQYLTSYREYLLDNSVKGQDTADGKETRMVAAYRAFVRAIFHTTHNHVFQLLATPLLNLRTLRSWDDADDNQAELEALVQMESAYFEALFEAIASGDGGLARASTIRLMQLPPEAIEAMRNTPVGQVPQIPISLGELKQKFLERGEAESISPSAPGSP